MSISESAASAALQGEGERRSGPDLVPPSVLDLPMASGQLDNGGDVIMASVILCIIRTAVPSSVLTVLE